MLSCRKIKGKKQNKTPSHSIECQRCCHYRLFGGKLSVNYIEFNDMRESTTRKMFMLYTVNVCSHKVMNGKITQHQTIHITLMIICAQPK